MKTHMTEKHENDNKKSVYGKQERNSYWILEIWSLSKR